VLAALPFVAGLDPEALERLAREATEIVVGPGDVVFREGDPPDGLYVVGDGWLKGSKLAATGREQVLRYFGTGDAVNEVGWLLGVANPATLVALEPSRLWRVPLHALQWLVDERPRSLWPITQNLARRLTEVVQMVEDLSLLPIEASTAKFLLHHAEDDVLTRRTWETQAELAARLGTVEDVLQRTLRALTAEGLITVERQRITILDRGGLETRASGA